MKKLLPTLAFLLLASVSFAGVKVLERSATPMLLEFILDGFELPEAGDHMRLDVSGMDYETRIGAPLIPLEELRIGLPPGSSINAVLLSSSQRRVQLGKRLLPVPEVIMADAVSSHSYRMDESLYLADTKHLLTPILPTSFRGVNYAPLEIRPFEYDGRFGLTVTEQAQIRIDIKGDTSYRGTPESDELTDVFLASLLNPDQASQWQSRTVDQINYADFSRSDHWLRLETDRDGMFRLGPNDLSSFPLADIDPRSFRLFSNGGGLLPFTILYPGNEFVEIPIRVVGDEQGWVKGIEVVKQQLGEPDASGRRSPVDIPGSNYIFDVDVVIVAIGQGPNPILTQSGAGLELRKSGNIVADPETGKTSRKGVFAGGDIVTGAATVILAMGAGRKAAAAMDAYLQPNKW